MRDIVEIVVSTLTELFEHGTTGLSMKLIHFSQQPHVRSRVGGFETVASREFHHHFALFDILVYESLNLCVRIAGDLTENTTIFHLYVLFFSVNLTPCLYHLTSISYNLNF